MKNLLTLLALLTPLALALSGCEDVIDLSTQTGPSALVVDGWITTDVQEQGIRLSLAGAYFDNSPARPALNASVSITDEKGRVFVFTDDTRTGQYRWRPTQTTDSLGRVGGSYTLRVEYEGEIYLAQNQIRRVPSIDSLIYTEERLPFSPPDGSPREGYVAEFFARDFMGVGDCYWIKPLRGGKLFQNTPSNLNLAFDAAFSPGSVSDGIIFIRPLRQSINGQSLLVAGDTVGVELHSITPEAYFFLQQVRQESANGGIFAVPPANIPTNVRNQNPNGKKALGYFGASAVRRAETIIDPKIARPRTSTSN